MDAIKAQLDAMGLKDYSCQPRLEYKTASVCTAPMHSATLNRVPPGIRRGRPASGDG
jgi:hypothetical protein